jgi:hypothetical protein
MISIVRGLLLRIAAGNGGFSGLSLIPTYVLALLPSAEIGTISAFNIALIRTVSTDDNNEPVDFERCGGTFGLGGKDGF